MKKIFIVLLAVSLGVCSIAGCTQSDNNTSSTSSEQVSNESSEESQNSEQTFDASSEQSQNSGQTSDESKKPDESTSNSRLTLSQVQDIITEYDNFDDIWNEIQKMQLPGESFGSGLTRYYYWLDEDGREKIEVTDIGGTIYFITYDSEGNRIESKLLYDMGNSWDSELTLDDVKDIISKCDNKLDILNGILKIQPHPNIINNAHSQYWIDKDGKERILVYHFNDAIYFATYDSDGNLINKELLFGVPPKE